MQNHLDITTAARDDCVSGTVSGRTALTGGAACASETNATCAAKYEEKTRGTHRVGQNNAGADHSGSYDLVPLLARRGVHPEFFCLNFLKFTFRGSTEVKKMFLGEDRV